MANNTDTVGFFAGEVLERTAQRHPHKTALITKEEELSFSLLNRRVHALAAHLQSEGIKQGARVGLLLPNCAAIPLIYFATQRIGAVSVILDARLKGKELDGVLSDADLALLVVHNQLFSEASAIIKKAIAPMAVWIVDGEGDQSFEKRYSVPLKEAVLPQMSAEQEALILYTSGTTGDPKGVVLSYRNLAQYPGVMTQMGVTATATIRGCILPMSHIVGPIVCNDMADKGFTLVIFDQINPVTLLEGIQKYRISVFESVPIIFQLLLGVRTFSSYDTSSVEIAAMMGTTVPLPLLRAFQETQPHIKVIQGYGLTETSPLITLVDPDQASEKVGSIGRAVPNVDVKIVDDAGQEVPSGEAGEIITRGPHVMKGYFRQPAATAMRIREGWLHTGDVGKAGPDGYFYHLGRRDDMIITGGLNVYPAEVENLIYTYPGVQEAVVFAMPDSKRGQTIGAAVVPRPGKTIADKELLGYLRDNLANFKVPQRIALRETLPRTSTGKVIRDPEVLLSDE